MFRNRQFYHEHVKRAIVAFGMIFNNININRVDGSNVTQQVIRVPLAYSTKQKFISRIAQIPTTESRGEVALVLPRMGFEIQQFEYDPARKISPIQKNKAIVTGNATTAVSRSYVSTPYNMTLSLYIFAKNQEDGLQVVEQILPYFQPEYSVSIKPVDGFDHKQDVQIILGGVNIDDQYEGDFTERRVLIYQLDFIMKMKFYGPTQDVNIIREVNLDFHDTVNTTQTFEQMDFTVGATDDADSYTVTKTITEGE